MSVWLNWACLGERSADLGEEALDTREHELLEALQTCIAWVARWTGRPAADVFLTSSATEACDVLLRVPLVSDLRWLLTTNHAFGTITDAVNRYNLLLRDSTQLPLRAAAVDINGFLPLPPERFTLGFGCAVEQITGGAPALCVIDHVTSLHGLRLPIDLLASDLRNRGCRVIADGSQAVGLWPCPDAFREPYFACFHKYLNCPAGTGFGVLERERHTHLPAYVTTLAKTAGVSGSLPTLAAERWIECAARLGNVGVSAACTEAVARLRALLLRELGSVVACGFSTHRAYRSQILSMDLSAIGSPKKIWRQLESMGYRTRLDGHFVRVSLHHSLTDAHIKRFAAAVKEIASPAVMASTGHLCGDRADRLQL